jgi:tetratricopeptide (TPR) repeat protein
MPGQTLEQAMQTARRFHVEGKLAEAESLYRQILVAAPNHPQVLNALGTVLGAAGSLSQARDVLVQATGADPQFAEAWANLAKVYEQTDHFDDAILALRKAVDLQGDVGAFRRRLGVCLGKKGDLPAAIDQLLGAAELDPQSDDTFGDLAISFSKAGRFDEWIEFCRRRLEQQPSNAQVLESLAEAMWQSGRFEQTAEIWRRIIEIDPNSPDHHGSMAMCLLTLGDLTGGWREYEWRWQCESFSKNVRRSPQREWGCAQGPGRPDVSGRTILLYAEQGIGDTIHFVRYATILAQRGARVLVECPWSLKLLLGTCPGVRLVWARGEQLPEYDWHIPMLSLPAALETTVQTIPGNVPYLFADPARSKAWRTRVDGAAKGRLRVGLVWAGSPGYVNDARRSISPALLAPLAQIGGVTLFSLQKGPATDKKPPPDLRLVDFTISLTDFAESAALIEQLDLIISVDTAVAHLAGAMGKAVWTLLRHIPDWRWMLHRSDTPWYPTMRLFRQRAADDWPGVIEEVGQALAALVESRGLSL